MIDVLVKSIAEEKAKHLIAITTSGAGVTAAKIPPPDVFDTFIPWMSHAAVFAGFAVSCALFYKTYLDIKIAKRKLEENE